MRIAFQQLLKRLMMNNKTATQVFESLSSTVRLDAFRLLVKHGPQGLVAGEIASILDLPASNLSFHLKNLTQSGLLSVEQEGRYQRYRPNIALMLEVISFLTKECCAGHPEQCLDLHQVIPGKALAGGIA